MLKDFVPTLAAGITAIVIIVGAYSLSVNATGLKLIAAQKLKPFVYLQPNQPPNGTVGKPYPAYSFCNPAPTPGQFCGKILPKNKVQINPNGGSPNYTFIAGLGFPAGLKLNLNGNLTGTPRKAGTYSFQICATDRVGKKKCNTIRGLTIAEKEKATAVKYPQASIEVASGIFGYFTVGEVDQTAKSFGRLVRDYTLDAPGFSIVEAPRQERVQTHVCYDVTPGNEDGGRCYGAFWTMKTPDGCQVGMTLYGMSFDKSSNQTKFVLGVVNGPAGCPAGANGTYYSFFGAKLMGTQTLPGGGMSATIQLTYEVDSDDGISFKQLPNFTVTVGAERMLKPNEKLLPEKDPDMGAMGT